MSRLIDADAFLKQEIKRCNCVPLVGTCSKDNYDLRYILDSTPTVDAVEVVRCKDCKHAYNMPLGLCYLHYEKDGDTVACVEPDDFCSYGERRT